MGRNKKSGKSKYIGKILKGFEIIDYIPSKNGHNPKFVGKCIYCGNLITRARSGFLQENSRITCPCQERYNHHSMSYTRIYRIWQHMKKRCYDTNNECYDLYGGRGISVCKEWIGNRGFSSFMEWSLKNGYSDELSIDRIDVNGNYEPSNCRWATSLEQNLNKRNTLYATIDGETKTFYEWCKEYGTPYRRAYSRLYKGWNIVEAITAPFGAKRRY